MVTRRDFLQKLQLLLLLVRIGSKFSINVLLGFFDNREYLITFSEQDTQKKVQGLYEDTCTLKRERPQHPAEVPMKPVLNISISHSTVSLIQIHSEHQ